MLKIEITTPLSPEDKNLLRFLVGETGVEPPNTPTNEDVEQSETPTEDDTPEYTAETRPYGVSANGGRRKKAEIEQDKEIERLFDENKNLPGMPKAIPDDQPAAAILEEVVRSA